MMVCECCGTSGGVGSCASKGDALRQRGNQHNPILHARNFVMICGAKSRCKCSSGSIEELEFDIQGLFINTLQLSQTDCLLHSAAHQENVRRLNLRIELDVIAAAAPGVARVVQQIVHLICVAFHLPELVNRHIDITNSACDADPDLPRPE